MSISAMSSETDQYNQFTSNYFTKFPEKPTKANTFQYTLRNASVSNKELKGEIIYICLQHLLQCACPDNIAYIIARKVSNLVIQEVKQDETEEEESKEYESSAVAEVTLQTIHTICQLSYDELMTGVKPLPPSHVYSACGIKNMRRK
uniref:Uncharacterized protein n=1 Tax=Ciona savignyi TaxID=51511 RepID=H2ZPJ6_CIOSA